MPYAISQPSPAQPRASQRSEIRSRIQYHPFPSLPPRARQGQPCHAVHPHASHGASLPSILAHPYPHPILHPSPITSKPSRESNTHYTTLLDLHRQRPTVLYTQDQSKLTLSVHLSLSYPVLSTPPWLSVCLSVCQRRTLRSCHVPSSSVLAAPRPHTHDPETAGWGGARTFSTLLCTLVWSGLFVEGSGGKWKVEGGERESYCTVCTSGSYRAGLACGIDRSDAVSCNMYDVRRDCTDTVSYW